MHSQRSGVMWWLEPVYTSGNEICSARLVKMISHERARFSAGVRAFAVDFPSQEVCSFTGSRSNGSKENGFIREPVKSYSNRIVHVGINICTAEGDCFTSRKANTPTTGRLSQRGKRMTFIECHQFQMRDSAVELRPARGKVPALCLRIHPLRLTYLSSAPWFSRRCWTWLASAPFGPHLFARVAAYEKRSWSSQAGVIAERSVTEPQWLPDSFNRD